MPEAEDPISLAAHLAEEVDYWDTGIGPEDEGSLVDLINRVLDKGVVITGDVTLSVAGVDLVYLGLNAVLTSVSTARESLGRRVGNAARIPEEDH
jgi:hypothetical protein